MSRKTVQQPRAGATAKPHLRAHPQVGSKGSAALVKARIIAVCNQKGGCGKTTSVINTAAGLASLGKRVLVIDLDSQCNATTGLGFDTTKQYVSSFDFMTQAPTSKASSSLSDLSQVGIVQTEYENLFLLPGTIELSEFESRIASEIGRENKLKKAILPLSNKFDFIILDTPPSLGLISVNALNAASEVQIAMQAHPFALDGLNLLLETIELVKQELNPPLFISGVYITMFDSRTRISQEIKNAVSEIPELKATVFKTVIRQNVKVTEATQAKVPVMYYDMFCTGTQDYMMLAEEIAKQKIGKATSVMKANTKKSKNEKGINV
jgi:chromosome partitioning protein